MVAALLAVAGLVFAYIASWALIGGEIMTFGVDREDKILERLSMIEDEIDKHKRMFLLRRRAPNRGNEARQDHIQKSRRQR